MLNVHSRRRARNRQSTHARRLQLLPTMRSCRCLALLSRQVPTHLQRDREAQHLQQPASTPNTGHGYTSPCRDGLVGRCNAPAGRHISAHPLLTRHHQERVHRQRSRGSRRRTRRRREHVHQGVEPRLPRRPHRHACVGTLGHRQGPRRGRPGRQASLGRTGEVRRAKRACHSHRCASGYDESASRPLVGMAKARLSRRVVVHRVTVGRQALRSRARPSGPHRQVGPCLRYSS